MFEHLIPRPARVEPLPGVFRLTGDEIVKVGAGASPQLKLMEELLEGAGLRRYELSRAGGLWLATGGLELPEKAPDATAESYFIQIAPAGILAQASDAAGLHWAAQTLAQIFRHAKDGSVPCAMIEDRPAFPLRGYHDDISRGQVSTLEGFKRILSVLARFKLNCYSPYIEDMLEFKSFPEIGIGRGRLTRSEISSLLKEAARRGIRVIPTICLLGHSENILAIPSLSHLGRKCANSRPSSYDVSNPELKPFLSAVIEEVCEAFPSELIHGGFDEVRGLEKEEFIAHASWVASEFRKRGRRLVMYADMFANHFGFEALSLLPEDVVLCDWNYAPLESFPIPGRIRKAGRELFILSGLSNWCRLSAGVEDSLVNIRNYVAEGMACGASGVWVSGWGDNGYENLRDACWSQVACFAEAAWSGSLGDGTDALERFNEEFYGERFPELASISLEMSSIKLCGYEAWGLWHASPCVLERLVGKAPEICDAASKLLSASARWRRLAESAKRAARREADHLDHVLTSIDKAANLAERLLAASRTRIWHSEPRFSEPLAATGYAQAKKLSKLARDYKPLWLRHNKPEGLEVPLGRIRSLEGEYMRIAAGDEPSDGFLALDLAGRLDAEPLELAGIPPGVRRLGGAPFKVASGNFSAELKAGSRLECPLGISARLSDLSILLACSYVPAEASPGLRVSLFNSGLKVFEETLFAKLHLPDWFAPLGSNWGGSGTFFMDSSRVALAWEGWGFSDSRGSGCLYGAYRVFAFPLPREGLVADSLELLSLREDSMSIHVLGVSLEAFRSRGA